MNEAETDAIVAAKLTLWRRGDLSYIRRGDQNDLAATYYRSLEQKNGPRKIVWDCSRRYGKSTMLSTIANEHAMRNGRRIRAGGKSARPDRIIYGAPTREQALNIVKPIFEQVLEDCPEEMRPRWHTQGHRYIWPWGDEMVLDGMDDDRGNHLRGPRSPLILLDECGFSRHLAYVVNHVLFSQTNRAYPEDGSHGRIIMASTPPESPAHDWYDFRAKAQKDQLYALKTVYDIDGITEDEIETYASEVGGKDSTAFRREFLCERVVETARAVVPEFAAKEHTFLEYTRPLYCMRYVAMDLGLKDFTHALFAYYDFAEAQIVIEDEWCANYKTTDEIAAAVHKKTLDLWSDVIATKDQARYVRFIADNDAQQLHDLNARGLAFFGAQKQDSEALLNQMRLMVSGRRIIISRKCSELIAQLEGGIWNSRRSDYERMPGLGHLDGIDALKYLVRHVDYNFNPLPSGVGLSIQTHAVMRPVNRDRMDIEEKRKLWLPRIGHR